MKQNVSIELQFTMCWSSSNFEQTVLEPTNEMANFWFNWSFQFDLHTIDFLHYSMVNLKQKSL